MLRHLLPKLTRTCAPTLLSPAAQIEDFTIFTESGLVLWSKQYGSGISGKSNPVNQLISTVLLEVRRVVVHSAAHFAPSR